MITIFTIGIFPKISWRKRSYFLGIASMFKAIRRGSFSSLFAMIYMRLCWISWTSSLAFRGAGTRVFLGIQNISKMTPGDRIHQFFAFRTIPDWLIIIEYYLGNRNFFQNPTYRALKVFIFYRLCLGGLHACKNKSSIYLVQYMAIKMVEDGGR